MVICAINVCRNYKGRKRETKMISYHQIPNDPTLKSRWINIIRKSRGEDFWKPSNSTVLCSDHFRSKDLYLAKTHGRRRLKKAAIPCKALFLSSIESDNNESDDSLVDTNKKRDSYSSMVAPENMKKQSISKKQKHQYDPFKEYANVSTDEESQDEKEEITDEAENANVDQSEKLPVVTENVYVNTQIEDRQAKRARIETEDYQLDFTEQLYEFGKFVAEQLMCLDVEDARVAQAEIRELLSKFNTNKIMSCFVETPTIVQSEADKPSNVLTLTHKTKIPAVSAVKKSKPMSAKQTLPKSQLLNTAGPSGTQSGKKKLETLDSSAPSSSFSYVFVSAINAPDLTQSEYGTSNVSSATESSSISFSGISIKAEPEPQSPHSEVSPQIADTESANCSSTPVIKDEPDSYHVDVFQPNIINIQSHIKFEPDSDSDT